MPPPHPQVKAILVCDQIIHELGTNKKSLIGIFEEVHLPRFPARYPRIAVYINLTDAHGDYVLEMRLLSEDGAEFGSAKTPSMSIENPLATCEIALQVQDLQLPKPGQYEFQIFANDSFLATKNFRVRQINQPGTTGTS